MVPSLRFQQSSFSSSFGAVADPDHPLPTPTRTVVMSQPGIPASGRAPAGLQAQNGAASASGSLYTNGKYCQGRVAGAAWARAPADLWLVPLPLATGEGDLPAGLMNEWWWAPGPARLPRICSRSPGLVLSVSYLFIHALSEQLMSAC